MHVNEELVVLLLILSGRFTKEVTVSCVLWKDKAKYFVGRGDMDSFKNLQNGQNI